MPSRDLSAAPRLTLFERLVRTHLASRFFHLPLVQKVLSPARGDRSVHKFIRYSMVSGVAIVISQLAILICTWLLGFSGILANTVGAVAATPASYELNRKWAWGKRGKSHMWKEVVPFWVLTVVGYLGSTGTVQVADNLTRSHHVTGLSRSLALMGASLLAYGVVWIVKFLIFNHVVFATKPVEAAATSSQAGEGTGYLVSPSAHVEVVPVRLQDREGAPAFEGSGPGR